MNSETNLDDVMQIFSIFANVGKGEQAKVQDLQKAFNTTESDVIMREVRVSPILLAFVIVKKDC
jgi:ribosome maturation protein SDO1